MAFTAKVQLTIHAPVAQVWDGLTNPVLVKQYFFGSELVTTWQPQTSIFFRGEWEGKAYEDRGTVLSHEPLKALSFDYFSSWSELEDSPENYMIIKYQVKVKGESTVLVISQSNIDTLEKKIHSAQNWKNMLSELKKLLENAHH